MKRLDPAIDEAWEAPLAQVFHALGVHRDREFLVRQQQPELEAGGGPAVALAVPAPDPVAAVRETAFQIALLDLLAYAHRPPEQTETSDQPAAAGVRARLVKLHRKVLREGRHFTKLADHRQHRVRKRLKRLRYLAELAAPLFDAGRAARFLKHLEPLQDSLGAYNDGQVALAAYRTRVASDPRAWYGVGWLQARRVERAEACERALRHFANQKGFW